MKNGSLFMQPLKKLLFFYQSEHIFVILCIYKIEYYNIDTV